MKWLVFLLVLAGWAGATPLAVVVRTEGVVEMGLPKSLKPARAGELVRSEWTVRTAPGAKARLRLLADQAIIDLAGGTTLELRLIQRHDRILRRAYLLAGEAAIEAGDQSSDLRIETQTTINSTSGGQFGISLRPDGSTTVKSSEGAVKVCNPQTGEHQKLSAGMSITSGWDEILPIAVQVPVVPKAVVADSARRDSLMGMEVRLNDPVTGKSSVLRYTFKVRR